MDSGPRCQCGVLIGVINGKLVVMIIKSFPLIIINYMEWRHNIYAQNLFVSSDGK